MAVAAMTDTIRVFLWLSSADTVMIAQIEQESL
jgi:hypothetical protein